MVGVGGSICTCVAVGTGATVYVGAAVASAVVSGWLVWTTSTGVGGVSLPRVAVAVDSSVGAGSASIVLTEAVGATTGTSLRNGGDVGSLVEGRPATLIVRVIGRVRGVTMTWAGVGEAAAVAVQVMATDDVTCVVWNPPPTTADWATLRAERSWRAPAAAASRFDLGFWLCCPRRAGSTKTRPSMTATARTISDAKVHCRLVLRSGKRGRAALAGCGMMTSVGAVSTASAV